LKAREGEAIGWSLKIGRILGADIRLHWMFLALFLVLVVRDLLEGGLQFMAFTAAFLGLVFLSVFLHEVGHAWAGIRAGGRAEQILLWPLGGLAELHGVPPFPKPQIQVAVTGPLINLTLATALLGVLVLLRIDILGRDGFSIGSHLLVYSFWANVLMFGLNLLPAFPLDGGSVFRWGLTAWKPERGYTWATEVGVKVGKVMAVLLGVAGFVFLHASNNAFLLIVLAFMVYMSCEREKRLLEYGRPGMLTGPQGGYLSFNPKPEPPREPGLWARWKKRRAMRRREKGVQDEVEVRKRVDFLLDKISREGMNALTEKERAFLTEASKRFQRNGTS